MGEIQGDKLNNKASKAQQEKMEGKECSVHSGKKSLYCLDCKMAICVQCAVVSPCKADHKKAELKEVASDVQTQRSRDVIRTTALLTAITSMESELHKCSQKLTKLQNSKYIALLSSLKLIQERIESITRATAQLPLAIHQQGETIEQAKKRVLDATINAKKELQDTEQALAAEDYLPVIQARNIVIPDISDMRTALDEIIMSIRQLFHSLRTFSQFFVSDRHSALIEAGVQTENEMEMKPRTHDKLSLIQEDIKSGIKELIENMVTTNRQMLEHAKQGLMETCKTIQDTQLAQYKDEQKAQFVQLVNDFKERLHGDMQVLVMERLKAAEDTRNSASEAKNEERLKHLISEHNALWADRILNLEGALHQLIQYRFDGVQDPEQSRKAPAPERAKAPSPSALQLHFASFLNLSNVKEIFEGNGTACKAYIVGVKNNFGAVELASLIHELKGDICNSIEAVTLDHMYFKDLSPFTHLLQNAGNLRTLELSSCPFTSSQMQYILGKIAEHGRGIRRLVIENAMLGDQTEALVLAINKTNIKELRIVSTKSSMAKYIATFKNTLADTVEVVDFGPVKLDRATYDLLKEWQMHKKVLFTVADPPLEGSAP